MGHDDHESQWHNTKLMGLSQCICGPWSKDELSTMGDPIDPTVWVNQGASIASIAPICSIHGSPLR